MIARLLTVGFAWLALGTVISCATATGPDERRVATGPWGGPHAALSVTDAGAHIEFDCASGDITQPLALDAAGKLSVKGVYTREHSGPVGADEESDRKPARYTGRLAGSTLTIDVILADSNEPIGTFTLERGVESGVRKCR